MLDSAPEIGTALEGTLLAGRPVELVELPGSGPIFAVPCEPAEVLAAWQAARGVMETTGRTVAVSSTQFLSGATSELFTRFPYSGNRTGAGQSPDEIVARSAEVDVDAALRSLEAERAAQPWCEPSELVQLQLDETIRNLGRAPDATEVFEALGPAPAAIDIERWLFRWERQVAGVAEPGDDGYLDWFVPFETCVVVLLPTPNSWEVPAWLSFFGAEGPGGHERLIAVMRRWHERWEAEVVRELGTMLQFVVARPPTEPTDALDLAVEHELLASCTLPLPGISIRHHARVLTGRVSWFLHDRP